MFLVNLGGACSFVSSTCARLCASVASVTLVWPEGFLAARLSAVDVQTCLAEVSTELVCLQVLALLHTPLFAGAPYCVAFAQLPCFQELG
jgi:hypothetical protein